jgi:hypothetical protein
MLETAKDSCCSILDTLGIFWLRVELLSVSRTRANFIELCGLQ